MLNDNGQAFKFDYKIVLDRKIEYRAKGQGGIWIWRLGDGDCTSFTNRLVGDDFWRIESVPSGTHLGKKSKENVIEAIVKYSPNRNLENSDFGDTHGALAIEVDGSVHCSDAHNSQPKVKVFYENLGTNNVTNHLPNWAYYWEQNPIIQNLLNSVPGIPFYDIDECEFRDQPIKPSISIDYDFVNLPNFLPDKTTYGSCSFQIRRMELKSVGGGFCMEEAQQVMTGYVGDHGESQEIKIGEACHAVKDRISSFNVVTGSDKGIYVIYRTVAHEIEHAKIECEVWNFTSSQDPDDTPAGYAGTFDQDKDGYKDIWELFSSDGPSNGFRVRVQTNPYDPDIQDQYNPNYISCIASESCSNGTMFEERRCRLVELGLNLNDINEYDWSFDTTNKYQGKNYK